jgi:hypothetical protein
MSLPAAIRLVKSLSKAEKRQFQLFCKKHSGDKNYLELFDFIDVSTSVSKEIVEEKFSSWKSNRSLDNTSRYLTRLITDCLIQSKIKDDDYFSVMHGLLRIRVLKERNLADEAYKEIVKLKRSSGVEREQVLHYAINRQELNHLAEMNFSGATEKDLVDIQMKSRDLLRDIRNTHEHNSLFEILKYRLVHSGKTISEYDRRHLNDLLLSELSIVNAKTKHSLDSRKLHLLFQSHFFTNIGDYKSAIKTFYELNRLFEKNTAYWTNPPLDYFSSLDGTLDSLRTIGRFDEMPFYLGKLEQLDNTAYPEFFRFLVRKTAMIYHLVLCAGTHELHKALTYIDAADPQTIKSYVIVDEEKQSELLFCLGLIYFKNKNFKRARKYINEIVLLGKSSYRSMVYRASRLLNIIIHYEENDFEYVQYEMRSFTRAFRQNGKLLETENHLFKAIKHNPRKNLTRKNAALWQKMQPAIDAIRKDKFEMQLMKHFDFANWLQEKLSKR